LTVAGTEGLLVSYARCCRPIPDDPIIAFLSAGRGIVIHRDTCGNVEDFHKHPEKWQPVAWQQDLNRYFSSEVRVEAANKVGMLAAISAAVASTGTNIGHATVEQRDGDVSLMILEVEVKDRKHLARIVRTIRQMPEVLRVWRTQTSRRSRDE
jgi:(p)ppGpp synthase/HD superfamily hydrolase